MMTNKMVLLSNLVILLGAVVVVRSVTYDVQVSPADVAIGGTLKITVRLTGYTAPVGDIKIIVRTELTQQEKVVFEANRCFVTDDYISTGAIDRCDKANQVYQITFTDVTHDHIGIYRVEAPSQSPDRSNYVKVAELKGVTKVEIQSESTSVLAGEKYRLVCTVPRSVTLPVQFEWRKITMQGDREVPPSHVRPFTTPGDGYSSTLQWHSVRKDDNGQYECKASNKAGSKTSEPVMLNVFYGADSVSLSVGATDVTAGDNVTFTCSSKGGNPMPGLVLYYSVRPDTILAKSVQSSERSQAFVKTVDKSYNESPIACRTEVELSSLTVPTIVSEEVVLNVQFPPDKVEIDTTDDQFMEGVEKIIKCRGGESRPSGFLTWKKQFNDRVVGVEAKSSSKVEGRYGGFILESSISIRGKLEDNGARIWCEVAYSFDNGTRRDVKSPSKTLSILPVNNATISPTIIIATLAFVVVIIVVLVCIVLVGCWFWRKRSARPTTSTDLQLVERGQDGDPMSNAALMENGGPQVPRSVTYNCYNIYVRDRVEAHQFLSLDGRTPERRAIEVIPGPVRNLSPLQRKLSVPSEYSSREGVNEI